ncbi:hypothetical protein [Paenibacillus massiliensis]|uniref:hypothetical protein n=1 Tax=Paenibacillus massiliensis TaxID=225917 RepID=UPI00036F5C10|nr:hypothetical protein [Paenibacillus massiliensis]
MNIYLLATLIFIFLGSWAYSTYKKKKGSDSKAPDLVTIVGLLIALALGIAPVAMNGIQVWTWHTTVLLIACVLIIGRILLSWRNKNTKKQE